MAPLRILLLGMLLVSAGPLQAAPPALAQPERDAIAGLPPEAENAVIMEPADHPSIEELVERLERTEARLQQYDAERAAQMGQASVSTDAPPSAAETSVFGLLGDRWQSAGDPEISIINYQNRNRQSPSAPEKKKKGWYEKIQFRGYTQIRLNETVFLEDGSAPAQLVGDRSVGEDQNFLIRRARLIFFGDVSDHFYVYIQPDFAVTPPGSPDQTFFAQLRDLYGDIYLDSEKVHRIRVGQSKVPYGWENLQSSSNRIPLDRQDAFNSATPNERDLGVLYYYTPTYAQDLFQYVMDEGLKGSGNYGMLGFGAYNGQGGSLLEQNDNVHFVARLAVPYQFPNGQVVEAGVQGITGRYTVLSSAINPLGVGPAVRPAGTLETGRREGILENRIGWTGIIYPQPFGLQAEWTIGRGPALNDAQTEVEKRALYGGAVMALYKAETDCYGTLFPFARWQYFKGGYRSQRNAPYAEIDDWELGVEWQITPQVEFTTIYTFADRTNTTAMSGDGDISYQQFEGNLLRFQCQINY